MVDHYQKKYESYHSLADTVENRIMANKESKK